MLIRLQKRNKSSVFALFLICKKKKTISKWLYSVLCFAQCFNIFGVGVVTLCVLSENCFGTHESMT